MKTTKTMKFTLFITFFALLIGTSFCVDEMFVEGNGIIQTEIRSASGFSKVSSNEDFDVTIIPGTEYSVEVTAESNLLSYIETDVVGNTLKIRTRGLYSLRDHDAIEIFITTPVLNGLNLSGSGLIKTGSFISDEFQIGLSGSGDIDAQISADKLKAHVSGSGNIFLEGEAIESELVVSGSGKIKAYDLEQNHCEATISGSGDLYVNVSENLDANISGSGRVYYINHPAIHTSISGSGKVVDRN